jgi:hypothetical protein
MPQISTQEFERLPLRVHHFLAGVPLHDVWAVDLPRVRSSITLDEFVRTANALACTPSPIVRALVKIRLLIGQILHRNPRQNQKARMAETIYKAAMDGLNSGSSPVRRTS